MIVLFKYYYKFCVSFAFLILTMSQKILVQTTKSETHNIILDVIEDALNFLNKGNLYSPIFGDLTMIMIIVISMIMIIVILVKVFVIFWFVFYLTLRNELTELLMIIIMIMIIVIIMIIVFMKFL